MKARYLILAGAIVAAAAGAWYFAQTDRTIPGVASSKNAAPGSSDSMLAVRWIAPPPSWADKSVYSEPHNKDMGHLWNQVRLQEHWDTSDADFIIYALSNPPTFTGTNWGEADTKQNEQASIFMNASSIFAEHLQIGGTIDGPSVEKIKAVLVERLNYPVAYVRGYAALALIQANFLNDANLRTRIEGMGSEDNEYVRSVIKAQFENLASRLKAAR